jgi:uncharacterized protein (DUF488 family)
VARKPTIFTIGHSTHSLAELVAILEAHGIRQVVDIRSIRRSRANPQFEAATLARGLRRRGIAYVALEALGGRRPKAKPPPKLPDDAWEHPSFRNYADYAQSPAFRAGLDELLALAKRVPTAIMCAEAVWWRCHRRIVADHLLARGVPVMHVLSKTKAEPATPTPFAVFTRGRVHYPRTPRASRAR